MQSDATQMSRGRIHFGLDQTRL